MISGTSIKSTSSSRDNCSGDCQKREFSLFPKIPFSLTEKGKFPPMGHRWSKKKTVGLDFLRSRSIFKLSLVMPPNNERNSWQTSVEGICCKISLPSAGASNRILRLVDGSIKPWDGSAAKPPGAVADSATAGEILPKRWLKEENLNFYGQP